VVSGQADLKQVLVSTIVSKWRTLDEKLVVIEHDVPGLGLINVRYSHLIGKLRDERGRITDTHGVYVVPGQKVKWTTEIGMVHPDEKHLHLSFMKRGIWAYYSPIWSKKLISMYFFDPALYIPSLKAENIA
jgi:hypothetical protein